MLRQFWQLNFWQKPQAWRNGAWEERVRQKYKVNKKNDDVIVTNNEYLCDDVFNADHTSGAILPLCQEVAVHLIHDIPYRLLPDLKIVGLRAVSRGVHYPGHVNSGALAGKPPEKTRNEREYTLEHHYKRNPLVVADHFRLQMLRKLFLWNCLVGREVVCVANLMFTTK